MCPKIPKLADFPRFVPRCFQKIPKLADFPKFVPKCLQIPKKTGDNFPKSGSTEGAWP